MRDVRTLVPAGTGPLDRACATGSLAFEAKLSEPEIVRQLMQSLDEAAASRATRT